MTLELRQATFGYPPPGRTLASDVTLALHPGEVLALLGPNGAGKSTLFRVLLGLLPLQAGSALLDGVPLSRLGRRGVARRVGYVPQAGSGAFPFPVLEAVLLGRAPHHGALAGPTAADRRLACSVLERLGIAHLAGRPCTRLSGGEAALVRIARALVQEPAFLVLDEPTASLDYGNRVRLLDLLGGLARDGLGVLLSTHDPGQAAGWADRVALLAEGRLLAEGAPAEVLTEAALRILFGVEVVAVDAPGVRGRMFAPRARAVRPLHRLAVVAPGGGGKTDTLLRLAGVLRARGVAVAGVVQPAVRGPAGVNVAYGLTDVATGEQRPLARRRPPEAGRGFLFEPEGWRWAADRIREGRAGADILIVDELGHLEAEGLGHLPALLAPPPSGTGELAAVWLLGVQARVADRLAARLGGFTRMIPPVAPGDDSALARLADEVVSMLQPGLGASVT